MRPAPSLGCLSLLLLLMVPLYAQEPESSLPFTILYDADIPSERQLVESLQRHLNGGRLRLLAASTGDGLQRELEALDGEQAAGTLVALGQPRARLVLAVTRRVGLVLGGDLGPEPGELVALGAGRVHALFPIGVPPEEVARTRALLLPGCERVGVITATSGDPQWAGIAPVTLAVAAGSRTPEEVVRSLAPQVDALLIPDDEGILPVAAKVLEAARKQALPVMTTSPWLARAGAAVGVVPDLDLAGFCLAMLLEDRIDPISLRPPPCLRVVNASTLRELGAPLDVKRAAEADVLLGLTEERRP